MLQSPSVPIYGSEFEMSRAAGTTGGMSFLKGFLYSRKMRDESQVLFARVRAFCKRVLRAIN
nr:MAG: hypothetical protein AM324_01925 [Candidatus Thorarchaeota archaeon SMTZ1-83]